MKKFIRALLALSMTLGMAIAAVACGGDKGGTGSSESSSAPQTESSESVEESNGESSESVEDSNDESSADEEDEDIFIPDYTSPSDLVEYFDGKAGTITYNSGKDLTIESVATDSPIYLGAWSENNVFTVDGGDLNNTLTITGAGGGVVQADGGILIIRNLTIRNNTHGFEMNHYREHYAEFGGKVRFENCIIECSIQLRSDADAEFINCEVKSSGTDMYGIWVAEGSAKFDSCTFTGWRGLKVHEIGGMDVVNVTVENCTFDSLTTKPAIAIDFEQPVSFATITFTNCAINNCAEYKKIEGVVGVDGFFESKTALENFTFTATGCTLNEEPFDFVDGEMIYTDWI